MNVQDVEQGFSLFGGLIKQSEAVLDPTKRSGYPLKKWHLVSYFSYFAFFCLIGSFDANKKMQLLERGDLIDNWPG